MQVIRLVLWAILLGYLPGILHGQSLVVCLDHTPEGRPLGVSDTFDIGRAGEELEFHFLSGDPLITPKLYFFIDILENGAYKEYDTKTHIPEHGTEWAVVQYRFIKSGTYRVLVLNADKQELCRSHVTVNVVGDTQDPNYYEGAAVLVCSAAPNGHAIDTMDTFYLRAGQSGTLTVLLRHMRPLATNRLVVDIWVGAGQEAGLYVETIELQTKPEWEYAQFRYEFTSYGVYTIRIFNEEDVYIGAAKLAVESK